jgi:microcystin-dependent protein
MSNAPGFFKDFLASLKSVAFSGSYTDLTNKPTISTAGASGSYTDLINTPTLGNYIGDFKHSAQTATHGAWLLCQGAAVSRTTYSSLFAIIGTSFGTGNGSTTFNLPDVRSSVLGSIGQRSGLTNRALGSFTGAESVTLTSDNNGPHTHNYGINTANGQFVFAGGTGMDLRGTNNGTTASSGSATPFSIMQPTVFAGNTFIYSGV